MFEQTWSHWEVGNEFKFCPWPFTNTFMFCSCAFRSTSWKFRLFYRASNNIHVYNDHYHSSDNNKIIIIAHWKWNQVMCRVTRTDSHVIFTLLLLLLLIVIILFLSCTIFPYGKFENVCSISLETFAMRQHFQKRYQIGELNFHSNE